MLKEIGSNFWLNPNTIYPEKNEISLDFLNVNISDIAFTSTGRGAIEYVLDHIDKPEKNKVALLPPFTCHTVIEPFVKSGYQVHYYDIGIDLLCSENKLMEAVEKHQPSIILVHGYFGFNTLDTFKDTISNLQNNTDIIVIEDVTQTLYSSFDHLKADYYICSFRKWTALPDGGFAISANSPFLHKPEKTDEVLLAAKLKAFYGKYLYIYQDMGNKDSFLQSFQEAENILENQETLYAMNSFSKAIQANLDIDFLRNKRRENFELLTNLLAGIEDIQIIFNNIPETVTPLYFPIYVNENRSELQSYLANKNVFAPVVWPKPNQVKDKIGDNVEWVYKHILAIPCDQRYSSEEISYIAEQIKSFSLSKNKD